MGDSFAALLPNILWQKLFFRRVFSRVRWPESALLFCLHHPAAHDCRPSADSGVFDRKNRQTTDNISKNIAEFPYPLLTRGQWFVKVMSMMRVGGSPHRRKEQHHVKQAGHPRNGDAAKKPVGGLQVERLGSFNHGGADGSRHGCAAGKRRQGRRGFLAAACQEPDPALRLR